MNILKKEIALVLHPTALMFLLLSAMVMIPSYPYSVVFFYTGLGVFFSCLSARENRDIAYTLLLPVAKRDIVRGRFALVMLLQLLQLMLTVPFMVLRHSLHIQPNAAGLEANIALLGVGFLLYGLFNLSFFGVYFRNIGRVGAAFVTSCTIMFLVVAAEVTASHAVPFVRDKLDTAGTQFLPEKLCVLAAGILLYAVLTLIAYKKAVKNFEAQDF